MSKKKISIHLLLPNGRQKNFSIVPGSNWKHALRAEIQNLYPRSDDIKFVEEPPKNGLSAGKSFKSGIMFEVRKDYYLLGHVTANINGDT